MDYLIRDVNLDDAKALLDIYSYYVLNTAITFEIKVPSISEFESRITKFEREYPYICLIYEGKIVGYSYAHAFYEREAYHHSVEVTLYIDKDYKGKGFGKLLYTELEKRLKEKGFTNLYACIAYTNKEDEYLTNDSESFHNHFGYHLCGTFTDCGYKFNRFYSMIWMEKIIK